MARIWSETLPHDELRRSDVQSFLSRFGLKPIIAVRPWELDGVHALAASLADAGVRFALWPMLADDDGRWASTANARPFAAFARRLADACPRGELDEMAIDFEPRFAYIRALGPSLANVPLAVEMAVDGSRTFADGTRVYAQLAQELRARGIDVSAAVLPHALLPPRALAGRILGTPEPVQAFSHVSVMAYTSMLEGLSNGLVGRRRARALLWLSCRAAQRAFGSRAGVSLGVVGTGALGNEPVYRTPRELAEDAATARAVGVTPTLFDLAGVLRRAPPEAWVEAFAAAG